MTSLEKKLKNPVWFSLEETHHEFLIEYDGVYFYHPDVCTFGAFTDVSKTAAALNAYSKLSKNISKKNTYKIVSVFFEIF